MTDFSQLSAPGGAYGKPPGQKTSLTAAPGAISGADMRDQALREAANRLEAGFLAEMLKAAGLGKPRDSFGGGAGEGQFASFLREAQADEMVKAGGIGLAESLYQALKERNDEY